MVPQDIRKSFVLTQEELDHELLLMTDRYTDELFTLPPGLAKMVIYPVSRLVADPERFPDDHEEPMSKVEMGVIYTKHPTQYHSGITRLPGMIETPC